MTSQNSDRPLITVIIPSKNEAESISLCVRALDHEKIKHGLIKSIIVVDNKSSDDSFRIAQTLPCIAIQSEGKVGHIRNVGAKMADTPYLAFIDADVVISPGWSTEIANTIVDPDSLKVREGIISGSICDIPQNANWIERCWFGSLNQRSIHNYINSGNLVIDRTLFNRAGGFDACLISGEDVDLANRAQKAGGILHYNPKIHAVHLGYPKTISGFFRREVWHGRTMINNIRHPSKDKALILALLHIGIFSSILLFTPIYWPLSILIISAYPIIPLALSAFRMDHYSLKMWLQLALLLSIYGIARGTSLIRSLGAKTKT